MSYLQEAERLERALAALISKPSMTLDDRCVQAALTAREALLGLLAVQLAEAAPLERRVTKADLQTIGDHPVAGLIGAVREHPRPHSEMAPSELYARTPTSAVGQRWLEVARRATLAQAEWEGRDQPLDSLQEWTIVRDVAATARALATLDRRLVSAANEAGCDDQVRPLTSESRLTLETAANEAGALAAAGEIASRPDRSRPVRAMPVPVRGSGDVDLALQALRSILARSPVVTPEHVRLVAIALARVARVCEPPSIDPATALSASLRTVAAAPHSVACPFRGDRRAAIQAGELSRWARTASKDTGSATATLKQVNTCVATLDRVVQRQLQRGVWFVPEHDPNSAFAWRSWNHTQPTPPLAVAIGKAADKFVPTRRSRPEPPLTSASVVHRRRPLVAQTRPSR